MSNRRSNPQAFGRTQRAFTLIELLVVIVILGILSTIAVVGVSQVRSSAIEKACINSAQNIAAAMEAYNADNAAYPTTTTQIEGYLSGNKPEWAAGSDSFYFTISPFTTTAFTITGTYKTGGAVSGCSISN